jgi:hypothetical protein
MKKCSGCGDVTSDEMVWVKDQGVEDFERSWCPKCKVSGSSSSGPESEEKVAADGIADYVGGAVQMFDNIADSGFGVVEFEDAESDRIKLEHGPKGQEYIYHIWTKANISNMQNVLDNIFEFSNADIEYIPEVKSWCVNVPMNAVASEGSLTKTIPDLILQI